MRKSRWGLMKGLAPGGPENERAASSVGTDADGVAPGSMARSLLRDVRSETGVGITSSPSPWNCMEQGSGRTQRWKQGMEDKYLRLRDENTALKRENNELRVVIKRCDMCGGRGRLPPARCRCASRA